MVGGVPDDDGDDDDDDGVGDGDDECVWICKWDCTWGGIWICGAESRSTLMEWTPSRDCLRKKKKKKGEIKKNINHQTF